MNRPIYLDHHATTPLDPRVWEAMEPYGWEHFGNPSSLHAFGQRARQAVERAREQVAALLGAAAEEIVFTSGATEANNLAIQGVARSLADRGRHLITGQTEHPAVLEVCRALEKEGFVVTYLPVDRTGQVAPEAVAGAITDETILVSLMLANNEIGTLHPLADIGRLIRERGVLFHCDAVQAVGKIPCRVDDLGVDLLSLSAHKMYGPKGVGALYVRHRRPRIRLAPLLHGGGQERGLRSGTLNVPGIVGLGAACELAGQVMAEEASRLTALRQRLWEGLRRELDSVHLNGHPTERLPGNLNVAFEFVDSETLLLSLPHIAASSGSACSSESMEPSHVLQAIGLREELIRGSIRFGLGRGNTAEEIDCVVADVAEAVRRLRALSPLYERAART